MPCMQICELPFSRLDAARVFTVCIKKSLATHKPVSVAKNLIQADMRVSWGHMTFCRFCHAFANCMHGVLV